MSNITLGPNAEVEIDEQTGELIIKTDADNVTFEQSNVNFDGNADHQGNNINNVGLVTTNEASVANQLGIPIYSDDANAPNETHFFNDSESALKYKDSAGTIYEGGGDVSNPMTEALDADGNDINNVGSLSTEDSITVTAGEATNTLHYGSDQDRANAGDESVAIGIGARANGDDGEDETIGRHTAIGYQAAQNNTGDRATVSGYHAARDNTGFGVTASGYQAARDNTGDRVTASGYAAAQNNTGDRVTASGYAAAQNNTGDRVTASGYHAARGDGLDDPTTMGDDNIGIGDSAIRNNQASGLIAIGQDAGINAQTDDQLIITQRDGTRRMVMDLTTGDLEITGTLTENATL